MLQTFNPQNSNLKIWVGDRLWARDEAKVSVFDSAVQGGDAVWEGLRVYANGIFALDYHLDRLFASAHAMAFANVPTRDEVRSALFKTLEANGMRGDSHVRLTLTRGEKITSGMDPRLNQKGCTLIVLAEWKKPVYDNAAGVRVVTSAIRRNSPQFVDSKIHHNNLINNILAKIQANVAGADDALMLDERGFVAEMNGTNIFAVRGGYLLTPHATNCLPGITRGIVLELGREVGIPTAETDLSLTELYTADEAFGTGTMGELTPVVEVDGRQIGSGKGGPLTAQLAEAFHARVASGRWSAPFP